MPLSYTEDEIKKALSEWTQDKLKIPDKILVDAFRESRGIVSAYFEDEYKKVALLNQIYHTYIIHTLGSGGAPS